MPQATPNPIVPNGNGGYQELTPQMLEAMPLAQFYQYKGQMVNAQSAFYYDSTYVKAGVAVTSNARKSLFTLGKSETDTQFGTSTTTGEKTEFLTNMISNGEFDNGTNFIMEGAGVQIVTSSNKPSVVGANGAITTPSYTASVVGSGVNNLLMVVNNLHLRFIRGEEIKKAAPLQFWPAPPGIGLEGAFGSPNDGFSQNGRGGLVQFTHPVVLEAGDKFQFDLVNLAQAAFTPDAEIFIRVILWGIAIKRQYPY